MWETLKNLQMAAVFFISLPALSADVVSPLSNPAAGEPASSPLLEFWRLKTDPTADPARLEILGETLYRAEITARARDLDQEELEATSPPAPLLRQVKRFRDSLLLSDSGLASYTTIHPYRLDDLVFALPLWRRGGPVLGHAPSPKALPTPQEQLLGELDDWLGFGPDDASGGELQQRHENLQRRFDILYQLLSGVSGIAPQELEERRGNLERRIDPLRSRLALILSSSLSPRQRREIENSRDLWRDYLQLCYLYGADPWYAARLPGAAAEGAGDDPASLFRSDDPIFYNPYWPHLAAETRQELTTLAEIKRALFDLGLFLPPTYDGAVLFEPTLKAALIEWPKQQARARSGEKMRGAALAPDILLTIGLSQIYLEEISALLDQFDGRPWPLGRSAAADLGREWQRFQQKQRGQFLVPLLLPNLLEQLRPSGDSAWVDFLKKSVRPWLPCLAEAAEYGELKRLLDPPEPAPAFSSPGR